MTLSRPRALTVAVALLSVPLTLAPVLSPPAQALTVYDPWNYAENMISAARALEQINNQITSLQNEAQMLINQARNLASLPHSSLQQIQQSVQRTQQLLGQAQSITFDVGQIDQAFQQRYGNIPLSASDAHLVAGARSRWQTTVGACRTRCGCRPALSAMSTPTAPRWRRLSAKARVPRVRFRPRRPATSCSLCSRSSFPT